MKVGLFGGTFDPVHIGHLIVAEEARVVLDLDQVIFMPTGQPWLKAGRQITEAHHRLAMVEMAVKANRHFTASEMELRRPGDTFTVDTLLELREQRGGEEEICLILGLDSLWELHRWRQPERVLELVTVVGMSRPGFEEVDPKTLDCIRPGASGAVRLLKGPLIGISGSQLRRRVSDGLSIKYRVPESVEAYIYEHGLYGGLERVDQGG